MADMGTMPMKDMYPMETALAQKMGPGRQSGTPNPRQTIRLSTLANRAAMKVLMKGNRGDVTGNV